ncbi:MAG: DUF4329 domain-containing protein [Limimaricola sp.]|uniref:DUF4329 domain-containing protein n=1 Tax=Limimaricola sp. TaxID=2211665 RepID=UPI001D89A4F6|nr:DUF4329 domain-containing protein [Limimaricola sp.]MBI1417698.1 DUF4329 domain-containing protein [Limimaricola sp.]
MRIGPAIACLVLAVVPAAGRAQDMREAALAKETLRALQATSFAKHREYCGYIGFDRDGQLRATVAEPGTKAGCDIHRPPGWRLTASYHTHGAFDTDYIGEIPSDTDIESDRDQNINGYVATPGGRFWFVDTVKMEVRQICGPGCLPVAPHFYKAADGPVAQSYTYAELVKRMQE